VSLAKDMSTLAERAAPKPQLVDHSVCTARLIPGRVARTNSDRKGPQSVRVDGAPRSLQQDFSLEELDANSHLGDFVLPSPFAGESLGAALFRDYALILLCWAIAFAVTSILERGPGMVHSLPRTFVSSGEAGAALLFAVIGTLMGFSEGLYVPESVRRVPPTVVLAKTIAWTTLLQGVVLALIAKDELLSGSLVLAAGLSYSSLAGWRTWREHQRRANTTDQHNVLIVGAGRAGREVARFFAQHPELGRTVRGFLDHVEGPSFAVLGPPEKLAAIARAEFADEIIVALPRDTQLAQRVIREARQHNLDVKAVPELFGCEVWEPRLEYAGRIPLITLHRESFPATTLLLKRSLDVVVSALALVLAAPLLLLLAMLVRLDSEGPVLYSAPRIGKRGRPFLCHKFRTMVANAGELKDHLRARNEREGPCFKIVDDPRITRVGRFLRRYSLDELPQLWNVLRGEMSLVGPRPHAVDDFSRYALEHFRRLDVTPGITGLWQVTARRSPSFHVHLALDLEYIEKWSLWMDIRILAKTLTVVFQGTGA
jgi:exopolysaccharide biosynthesis polyprenyl glycosylphosphotransferase